MTKRYSILQKKIQELESELNCVFSLAAQTQTHTPCPDAVLEDIHQKFVFVSNLLSAELASGPYKPHHLYHIARRLSELERAFLGWDGFKTSALNFEDNASTCSCSTESCLNDDGEASDDLGSPVNYEEDPERFSQGLHEEKALVEFGGGLNHDNLLQAELLDCLVEKRAKEGIVGVGLIEKDVKGKQKKVGIGRLCGARAMAGGVLVLGMALMGYAMGRFYGCFYYVEQPGCFLGPT